MGVWEIPVNYKLTAYCAGRYGKKPQRPLKSEKDREEVWHEEKARCPRDVGMFTISSGLNWIEGTSRVSHLRGLLELPVRTSWSPTFSIAWPRLPTESFPFSHQGPCPILDPSPPFSFDLVFQWNKKPKITRWWSHLSIQWNWNDAPKWKHSPSPGN